MTVSRIKSSLGLKKDEVKVLRDGKEIKLNTANIGSKNEQKFLGVQPVQEEVYQDEINAEMEAIVEENEILTRRLAVAAMEASDEEKGLAENQLMEMASQIKTLTATLNSAQAQSNTYMNQVAELKDQVKYWRRRAEKAEAKISQAIKI
jgi:chromosome segregation ATPase